MMLIASVYVVTHKDSVLAVYSHDPTEVDIKDLGVSEYNVSRLPIDRKPVNAVEVRSIKPEPVNTELDNKMLDRLAIDYPEAAEMLRSHLPGLPWCSEHYDITMASWLDCRFRWDAAPAPDGVSNEDYWYSIFESYGGGK